MKCSIKYKKLVALWCMLTFFLTMIPLGGNVARGATNSSYPSGMIGQFTFDDGTITNTVNSKTYAMGSGNSISTGWSGKGLIENGGITSVPMSDLGFTNSSTNATISFWYKWDGSNYIIPICFAHMSFYLYNGYFGVNTGAGDVFGTESNPFSTGKYVHVTLEITQGRAESTKIYVNGSPVIVAQRMGSPNEANINITSGNVDIGGCSGYTPHGSIIDNINIWNRSLTDDEVLNVYDNEKTDLAALNSGRVGQFSFNGSTITNSVNGKTYSSGGNDYMDAMNDKGLRLLYNKYATITASDMGITNSSQYLTFAFWYKWDGVDGEMPFHISNSDIMIKSNGIGLNTGNSDLYGANNTLTTQGFYHIVIQLTKANGTATTVYINGVKQATSFKVGTACQSGYPSFGAGIYINAPYGTGAYSSNNSIMDELSIYNRQLSDEEVQKLYNYEKTPLPLLKTRKGNAGIQLDWSTEIAPEDTIFSTGFENSNDPCPPSFWTDPNTGSFRWWNARDGAISQGNQKITSTNPIYGSNSYEVFNTLAYGNHVNSGADIYDNSIFYFGRKTYPKNVYMALQYTAKNSSSTVGYVAASGDGGWGASIYYHNVHLTQAAPVGTTVLHVDTLENYNYYGNAPDSYITTDTTASPVVNMNEIKAIDTVNKTITLWSPTKAAMSLGQQLNSRPYITGFGTGYNSILAADGTKRFSYTMPMIDCNIYDVSTQGLSFVMTTQTDGTLNLDDIKLGYASEVKVYKDNAVVYEGYASSYPDLKADQTAPTTPTGLTATVRGQNVSVSWNPSTDIGETHTYAIQGISRQAGSSVMSPTQTLSYTAGLAGYAYVIDQNSSTDPGNTVNATSTSFNQNLAPGTYYLHVKAIDNSGNVTATMHKQFTVLKNTPTITSTPNSANNNINLSWISSDLSQNYTYTVKKKLTSASSYTSLLIGTTLTSVTDTGATDTSAPNAVNNSTVALTYNTSTKKVQWTTPSDNGTSYDYQVVALGQSDSITQTSSTNTTVITTGIKGYYAVIDTSATTIPTSANLITTNSYDVSLLAGGNYYLHLISVDNANNISAVVHKSIIIPNVILSSTTQIRSSNNYIHLSWTMNDISQAYKYDVYRNNTLITTVAATTSASQAYDDMNGKDSTAPNIVSGISANVSGTTATITFNPSIDNGNNYSYYIVATGANGNVIQSNTVNPYITKGLAGYSYVNDSTANTTPDGLVDGISTSVTQNCIVGTNYFHISAVDYAGNLSTPVHQAILVNPNIKAYINSNDIDSGNVLTIMSTDEISIQISTNGAQATVEFPFTVRDGSGTSYLANTAITLKYDTGLNMYKGSFILADNLVTNGSTHTIKYKAYSADNTTFAVKSGKIIVKTLLITGLNITNIIKPVDHLVYPINTPVEGPINIKSGYNVTLNLGVSGQNYADLSFYSNGQPITIYSPYKLNQNTVRITSSNSIVQFVLCFDDLPVDSVIDCKATAYTNSGLTTVNSSLGIKLFKIVGSAKEDIFIDLVR